MRLASLPVKLLVAALAVSASAQTSASVSWVLTSDLGVTATAGAAAGSGARAEGLTFRDFTGSLGDGTDGLARWYAGDNWPDEAAPNPARGAATLRFDLAAAVDASVRVYDVRGRLVAAPAARPFAAGRHEVPLDTSGLAAGIYVVRLRTATEAATQKLLVVR